MSGSEMYMVEKLLGKKGVRGKVKYKVHWKGYSARHDSWEPAENLTNCQDMIDAFNETLPAGSAATVLLSSDDELSKTTSQSPPRRKRPPRKSMSRKRGKSPARVTKTDDKREEDVKPANVSSIAPTTFTRTYELRSTSKRREAATKLLSFSDDESSPVAEATKKSNVSTRMSLSESKFRKHLADNQKDSTQPTSTPFTQPSPAITTNVKTRLHFSPDRTTRKTRSSARVIPQGEEVTIAEDTEEEHAPDIPQPSTQEEKGEENKENRDEGVPAWLHVGWAEFGLATFVTGLAVVGYYFFSS